MRKTDWIFLNLKIFTLTFYYNQKQTIRMRFVTDPRNSFCHMLLLVKSGIIQNKTEIIQLLLFFKSKIQIQKIAAGNCLPKLAPLLQKLFIPSQTPRLQGRDVIHKKGYFSIRSYP